MEVARMGRQYPIVVSEVTFNDMIFRYPLQFGTLWIWLTWEILFPALWTITNVLFSAAVCTRSSDISSVIAGCNRSRKNMLTRRDFRQLQTLVTEYFEPSDRGHVRDVVDFFQIFALFSKQPCWYKTTFVTCCEALFLNIMRIIGSSLCKIPRCYIF